MNPTNSRPNWVDQGLKTNNGKMELRCNLIENRKQQQELVENLCHKLTTKSEF